MSLSLSSGSSNLASAIEINHRWSRAPAYVLHSVCSWEIHGWGLGFTSTCGANTPFSLDACSKPTSSLTISKMAKIPTWVPSDRGWSICGTVFDYRSGYQDRSRRLFLPAEFGREDT